MKLSTRSRCVGAALLAGLFNATPAYSTTVHYDFLAAGYTQEIYTGPIHIGSGVTNAGMVWNAAGDMVTKDGNKLNVYAQTTTIHQGTNVHPVASTYTVPGLDTAINAVGITKGAGGYIYANTSLGLQRIDPSYASAVTLAGTAAGGQGLGVTTLPDGRIAYVGGTGNHQIFIYDPSTGTNNLLFTSPNGPFHSFDDIEANAAGQIALAAIFDKQLMVIDSIGTLLSSVSTNAHFPDGIAFVAGSTTDAIIVNNNDGSISRYDYSAGYASLLSSTDIATTLPGRRAYGDLAACGPDGAFYVTQYDVGVRGSNAGFATKWDNGTNNNEASIIRIASSEKGGNLCAAVTIPEPPGLPLLALGLLFATSARSRLRRKA